MHTKTKGTSCVKSPTVRSVFYQYNKNHSYHRHVKARSRGEIVVTTSKTHIWDPIVVTVNLVSLAHFAKSGAIFAFTLCSISCMLQFALQIVSCERKDC